jgi:hypothetical protein
VVWPVALADDAPSPILKHPDRPFPNKLYEINEAEANLIMARIRRAVADEH